MADIFLSYARRDATLVQALAEDLRALGNTMWWDEELSGGQLWWDRLLDQIRRCDVFVFALSPTALGSHACRREWEYAAVLGKPILPVLVTEGVATTQLPPALATIQYIDYQERTSTTSLRLARALIAMPPVPPLPEPLPDPPEVPLSYLGQVAAQISGDEPLTFADQSAVVFELRRRFTDPEVEAEAWETARTLLTRLRSRRDLLAQIADEIDRLLGTTYPAAATLAQLRPQVKTLRSHRTRWRWTSVVLLILLLGASFLVWQRWSPGAGPIAVELADTKNQLATAQQATEQLETAQQASAKTVRDLEGRLARVTQSRDTLQAKADQVAQELKNLKGTHAKTRSEVSALETQLARVKVQLQARDTTIAELRSQLSRAMKPTVPPKSSPSTRTNSIGMEFVLISAGTFQMGSRNGADDEKPVHQVTISTPFYLGKYEVTQAQWQEVMDTNPSQFAGDLQRPVEQVSWEEVQAFIRKLNEKEGGKKYRLPTEAE